MRPVRDSRRAGWAALSPRACRSTPHRRPMPAPANTRPQGAPAICGWCPAARRACWPGPCAAAAPCAPCSAAGGQREGRGGTEGTGEPSDGSTPLGAGSGRQAGPGEGRAGGRLGGAAAAAAAGWAAGMGSHAPPLSPRHQSRGPEPRKRSRLPPLRLKEGGRERQRRVAAVIVAPPETAGNYERSAAPRQHPPASRPPSPTHRLPARPERHAGRPD